MTSVVGALRAGTHLLQAAGVEDARLECELLLAHALGIDRAHLLASFDDPLLDATGVDALLRRRAAREPLAYIVGYCEFYGVRIACSPAALIPRPETEMLVDLALEECANRGPLAIADVGTGSAAVAVAIAANARDVRVVAVDADARALSLAARNVDASGVSGRVALVRADLLQPLRAFDVVVANLPYIPEADFADLTPEIREFEPRDALVAGATGTEAIERLIADAPKHLRPGGVLAVEFGDGQGEHLRRFATRCFPESDSFLMKDLAGLDRVLVVRT